MCARACVSVFQGAAATDNVWNYRLEVLVVYTATWPKSAGPKQKPNVCDTKKQKRVRQAGLSQGGQRILSRCVCIPLLLTESIRDIQYAAHKILFGHALSISRNAFSSDKGQAAFTAKLSLSSSYYVFDTTPWF